MKWKEVDAILRLEPLDRETMKQVDRYPEPGDQPAMLGNMHLIQQFRGTDIKALKRRAVATKLQLLVDVWIESGVLDDGSEMPRNRNLLKTPELTALLRQYSKQCQTTFMFFPKRPEFIVEVGEGDAGTESSLSPRYVARPFEEPLRLFFGILMNVWGRSLCKCRHPDCGRYFLHKKLRQVYKNGTYCSPAHQRHAKAGACNRDRRARAQRELIETAARHLAKIQPRLPWHENRAVKTRLAAILSERISRNPNLRTDREQVASNWVTHHASEIEKRRLELCGR